MPYVILRQDMLPDSWQTRASKNVDFAGLLSGEKTKDISTPVRIELESDCETRTDFFEAPYFIVSSKMREALESFHVDNIDYHPDPC